MDYTLVLPRRELIKLLFGAGALTVLGCSSTTDASNKGNNGTCPDRIPEETAGPYPGEGSNGPNVLNQTGVVRSDIRSSFAGLNGTAAGIPLAIKLTLVNAATCAPLAGYAVYLWHADALGRYSLYSSGVTNQNYLRGVQAADANGVVTFQSIYPGAYAGRWPHIHFEVFRSLTAALSVSNKIATSQIALPKSTNDQVYQNTAFYPGSLTNASLVTLANDSVFSDGSSRQLANMTGDLNNNLTANLTVAVNA